MIGQGVADINIARQTCAFWHIKLTDATFIPMFDSVIALSLLLHSASCTYLPDEMPTDITCRPPDKDFKHDCCPLLIKLGLIAVDTGIDLEPAPL